MGRVGRPRLGYERTDLAGSAEGLALAALVRQTGGDIKQFSKVMDVGPSTMTKWISGAMKAPPRSELIRGLQYACSGRGYDPASLAIRRLGQPGLTANEGCSLFAAHAVQRYVGRGFVPPKRGLHQRWSSGEGCRLKPRADPQQLIISLGAFLGGQRPKASRTDSRLSSYPLVLTAVSCRSIMHPSSRPQVSHLNEPFIL